MVGSALSIIFNSNDSKTSIEQYKVNLTRLVQPIDRLYEKKSRILWTIQAPVNEEKLSPEKAFVENNLLDLYNNAAIEVSVV